MAKRKRRTYDPTAWEKNRANVAQAEAREAARNKKVIDMRIKQTAALLLGILLLAALLLAAFPGLVGVVQ